MSNQESMDSLDDSRAPSRSDGRWNSALGAVGLALAGLIVFWSSPGEAVEPQVTSRTAIHWRQSPIFSLAWSPDSRKLAASCFGPVVRVWDRDSGLVSSHEGGTEQPRFVVGWSPDGRRLLVSGLDFPVESWDLSGDEASSGLIVSRPSDPSESTGALVQSSGARSIRLWGESDRRFGLSSRSGKLGNSIAFSADGRFRANGGLQGRLEIRDPASGVLRRQIEVAARGITAVCFSPDSSKVATSGPGPVRIWDVESGREVTRFGDEESGSATLAFGPDGLKVAVATWDGTIQVWDLTTKTLTHKLRGHHGQILTLAWSPDGKTLASGGYDSTVKVWDIVTSDSVDGPG
jgi:WD40 repeat protein